MTHRFYCHLFVTFKQRYIKQNNIIYGPGAKKWINMFKVILPLTDRHLNKMSHFHQYKIIISFKQKNVDIFKAGNISIHENNVFVCVIDL